MPGQPPERPDRAARLRRTRLARSGLTALGAAALYALASPPWDLALLAWPVPALLLLPASRLSPGRASVGGLIFGFAIAATITRWAFEASLQYFDFDRVLAAVFIAAVWVVWSGLPYALLTAAYAMLAQRTPALLHPWIAAWLWVVVEVFRSIPVLGMPWGLLSHTQWQSLPLIQVADLGGAYAVTFCIVFVSVSVGLVFNPPRVSALRRHGRVKRLVPAAAVLALVLGYGATIRSDPSEVESRSVAVVQGNVPNEYRWKRAFFERNLIAYLRLSSGIGEAAVAPDLVVWPENAVNFYLDREPMMLHPIRQFAMHHHASLVVGAPRLGETGHAHNSAFLIGPTGRIMETYDKQLLVPFAEGSVLPTRDDPASDEPRYEGGGRGNLLSSGGLRLGTLICFEILFPHLSRRSVLDGANVLVNISNDSWMDAEGSGAAPRQHFAMAVFRAVELRRPLVRASSGGVSGFVSPFGDVRAQVPWGESGLALGEVQPRDQLSPYARYGDSWILVLTALLALATAFWPEDRSRP